MAAQILPALRVLPDRALGANWRYSLSADARFTDDYAWTATLKLFVQDSFWVVDAAISVYSDDERHQLSLIGRNIGDEYCIIGGGAIPGRAPIDNTGANTLDQAATPLGRTITFSIDFPCNSRKSVTQEGGHRRLFVWWMVFCTTIVAENGLHGTHVTTALR